LGAMGIKAVHKYVDEIEPRFPQKPNLCLAQLRKGTRKNKMNLQVIFWSNLFQKKIISNKHF
jgi:hypothetical protein